MLHKATLSLFLAGAASLISATSARAQMVTGSEMQSFGPAFGLKLGEREYPYAATLLKSSAPGNIVFPGEQPTFSFQLQNNLSTPIQTSARVELIPYGTRGIPGDIWKPEVFAMPGRSATPIAVSLGAKGTQSISVSPRVPAKMGGYALVVDLGAHGRQFVTSFVRTFQASPKRLQYPKMSLDYLGDDILRRLGVQAIRLGVDYIPSDDPSYAEWKQKLDDSMRRLRQNNITALVMWGTGHRKQPLGRGRPHLDKDGVMLGGKEDIAWLPSSDADFQAQCRALASQYGWPKGPVTAMSLWNEPWEGLSISGWGADMIRYREIFMRMAQGVEAARAQDKVQVLVAGADSSSNTFDKFFSDGSDKYLQWLDAVTIHYQGLASPSTYKAWINRRSPRGRVQVWDTESWVANTDDRLAAVVAANRASGYDRSMGIFGGNIAEEEHEREWVDTSGQKVRIKVPGHTWSPAASVGAVQHFIGERPFRSMLFPRGLPWIMLFDGQNRKVDDGTVVVVGDLGEAFGNDSVLFRGVRGLAELNAKKKLREQMEVSRYTPEGLAAVQAKLDAPMVLSGGSMTLKASSDYSLFDFYGNRIAPKNNKIVIPLDSRGFFLRPSGEPGSFARLTTALKTASVEGYEPLDIIARDMTSPISFKPTLRLTMSNILNRPVKGSLNISLGVLKLSYPKLLSFKPFETKQVLVKVLGGTAMSSNSYPLAVRFNAGRDGRAEHDEVMHANVIARRTPKIDGNLDDWKGVLPQSVSGSEGPREMTEAAWFPFTTFGSNLKGGLATGYAAYDSKNFYFATKVADSTPSKGAVRFETRDDDAYFYPAKSFEYDRDKTLLQQIGDDKPKSDDPKYLQLPDGEGRSGKFWEHTNKNLSFAIDLNVGPTQVAVYLGAGELHPNGIELQIIDRETGRVLDTQKISKLWGGTYAVWNVRGQVRIRLQTNGDWYAGKIYGIFFDPRENEKGYADAGQDSFANWVKWDHDTQGNWKGVYGSFGYALAGQSLIKRGGFNNFVGSLSVPEEIARKEHVWPSGVRRYSYRTWPAIPGGFGAPYDGVQIAFNAIPVEQEDMLASPPGTPKYFTDYKSTDYEYDLHPVAAQHGGGTEVWRLLVPGMPRKHFYPRQPKSKFDGAVKSARLSVKHMGNTRIMEAAIPWSEIPHVQKLMAAKQPVKFAFLVQDDEGPGQMETGRGRSVSKKSGLSFHVDWGGHWSNEVEFGWEK